VTIEKHGGLTNTVVLRILFTWYLFSALTLFTNKYIISYAKGNPTIIGIHGLLYFSLYSAQSRFLMVIPRFESDGIRSSTQTETASRDENHF
jgi:hypothetical protein